MTKKNEDVEIKPGQVWADKQAGQEGRTIEVLRIVKRPAEPGNARIEYVTRTPTDNAFAPEKAIGRRGSTTERNLRRNFELTDQGVDLSVPSLESVQAGQVADALRAGQAASATLDALQTGLAREGGAITLSCRRGEWVAGIHFGAEEPDNPDNDLAAGAAYGMGETLMEALTAAVDETGWRA